MRGSLRLNKDCNILTPRTLLAITAFLFCSPRLLNRGPSLCWDIVLIPASLQLIGISCCRGYIIIWHPPTSCERQNSHSIQTLDSQGCPWSPDIFDRMHLLFTPVHFFFWQLGRVRRSIWNTLTRARARAHTHTHTHTHIYIYIYIYIYIICKRTGRW